MERNLADLGSCLLPVTSLVSKESLPASYRASSDSIALPRELRRALGPCGAWGS